MTEAIARILVPVDFSPHSDRALRYATMLADRFGASVALLHVVEDPFVSGAWSSEAIMPNIPELLSDLVVAAREHIEELRALAVDHGVKVEAHVHTGPPARTIAEYAQTEGFDLIVMGTHGRTGLLHALMGSVAERVVRQAPCPVLTVRDQAAAKAQESSAATAAA